MKTSPIGQLFENKEGKAVDKWSWYFAGYEHYFEPLKTLPINLLEIGIQNGGSLEVWGQYFHNAVNIVGCDINADCADLDYDDARISTVIADAASDEGRALIQAIAPKFDIVLDDGSHVSSDIIESFIQYFPMLNDGGIYIVEDLHCSYWPSFGGGVLSEKSAMAFFKVLLDFIHSDYWPRDYGDMLLAPFGKNVGRHHAAMVSICAAIESIEFRDSMCFIRREVTGGAECKRRVIAGSSSSVSSTIGVADKAKIEAPPEDRESVECGPISKSDHDSALAVQQLISEREALGQQFAHEQQLGDLRDQIKHLQYAIRDTKNSLSWRISAPLRFILSLVLSARQLPTYMSTVLRLGGGFWGTARLALNVIQGEGAVGLRWRLTNARRIAGLEDGPVVVGANPHLQQVDMCYQEWVNQYDTLTDAKRKSLLKAIASFSEQPLISIVMPVFNPSLQFLTLAIESVRAQLYENWELCIADDASDDNEVRDLIQRYARADSRLKYVFRNENGHISRASNSALTLATGDYVALLDQDDLLPAHALAYVAEAINRHPSAAIVYSDEDKVDEAGTRFDPYFKPDFNWELFLGQNMISHLGVYRRALLSNVGGFREGVEGSQDWDLAFRVVEASSWKQIVHIPRVLYHWRALQGSTAYSSDEKPYARVAGMQAVKEHLARSNIAAEVSECPLAPVFNKVRFALPPRPPKVSIIIPTRDQYQVLAKCVASIQAFSSFDHYEIIIVDNGSTCVDTLRYLSELAQQGVRVLRYAIPFNYSKLNNYAVAEAAGDVICLLNNDIEIITPDWLEEMLSHACRPDVGCVGAKLYYPDMTLQHGGVIIGIGGVAGHFQKHLSHEHPGYFGRAALLQEMTAVTGACLMVRRCVYEQVGGLNEDLAVAFNDIDFCLKVRQQGYRNIWTPFAECCHHESLSRGDDASPQKAARFELEVQYMQSTWGDTLAYDPVYNPNLSLDAEQLMLARPPRVIDL